MNSIPFRIYRGGTLLRPLSTRAATQSSLSRKIRHWEKLLSAAGVEDYEDSVRCIVAHAATKTVGSVDTGERYLTENQLAAIEQMIEQRRKRKSMNSIAFRIYRGGAILRQLSTRAATQSNLSRKIRHWEKILSAAGVEDYEDSVRCIVAHAATKTGGSVDTGGRYLTENQLAAIEQMIEQRRKRVPFQYIIGECEFLDLRLKVRPPILVPRRETEVLVEKAIENTPEPGTFLEVGCGSGAISLALLRRFGNSRAVAIDCDDRACQLTRENARIHQLDDRIAVHHLKLDRESMHSQAVFQDKYDMIISNPPYGRTEDIPNLVPEMRDHESWTALDGGEKGLDVTMLIMELAGRALTDKGLLWLQVSKPHPERVAALAERFDLKYIQSHADCHNVPRLCQLQKKT